MSIHPSAVIAAGAVVPASCKVGPFSTIGPERTHVGSMGIYLFKKKVLFDLLTKYSYDDFGKQIIRVAT